MKVTVRTLDSVNHVFELEGDEITVKEFKELIYPKVNIPVNVQRIIFRGKVLNDEKKLKDYGVDNCVVHLVERAPPQPVSEDRNSGSTSTPGSHGRVPDQHAQHLQQHLNALAGSLDPHGLNVINVAMNSEPTRDNNVVMSRLTTAQRFLNHAEHLLQHVEAPVNEQTDSSSAAPDSVPSQTSQGEGNEEAADNGQSSNGCPLHNQNREENESQRTNCHRHMENSPQTLGRVFDQFNRMYEQFLPTLRRYQDMLNNPTEIERTEEDDMLSAQISEIFHDFAHMFHALSDLTYNFSGPSPHTLMSFPSIGSPLGLGNFLPNPHQMGPSASTTTTTHVTSNGTTIVSRSIPIAMMQITSSNNNPQNPTSATTNRNPSSTETPANDANLLHQQILQNLSAGGSFGHFSMPSSAGGDSQTQSSTYNPLNPNININVTRFPTSGNGTFQRMTTPTIFGNSFPMPTSSSGNSNANSTSTSAPRTNTNSNSQSQTFGSNEAPPDMMGMLQGFLQMANVIGGGQQRPTSSSATSTSGNSTTQTSSPFSSTRPASNSTSHQNENRNRQQTRTSSNAETVPGSTPGPTSTDTTSAGRFRPHAHHHHDHPDSLLRCRSYHFGPSFNIPTDQVRMEITGVEINQTDGTSQPTQGANQTRSNPASQNSTSQPGGGRPGQQPSSTLSITIEADNSDGMDIDDMDESERVIMQQVQQMFGGLGGLAPFLNPGMGAQDANTPGANILQSMRDLLQTPSGSSQGTEEDFFSELLDVFERLNPAQFTALLLGSTEAPMIELHPHLKRLLEKHFNNGQPITEAAIPQMARRMATEAEEVNVAIISNITVRDDVDFNASLAKIYERDFTSLLRLVMGDAPSFARGVTEWFSNHLAWSIALIDYSVIGGLETHLDALFSGELLQRALGGFPEGLRQVTIQGMIARIRSISQRNPISQAQLNTIIVKPNAKAAAQRDKPSVDSNGERTAKRFRKNDEDEEEKVNVDEIWEEMRDGLMTPDDSDTDTAPSPEDWHSVVPNDWVLVINRDVERQRRMVHQRPYSDAYLSGLPKKKRKLLTDHSEHADRINVESSLKKAIKKTDSPMKEEELNQDVENNDLQSMFEATFRHDIRQRLQRDEDYRPKQHPNSEKYFMKDQE